MMTTACARLSDAKAGLIGSVTMASASATSSLSSPLRSRPNRTAMFSPEAIRGATRPAASAGARGGLAGSGGRGGGGKNNPETGDRRRKRGEKPRRIEPPARPGRHHARFVIGPALPRIDEPQLRQAEIRHGAGGGADILAELRLDQDHDRAAAGAPIPGAVGACSGHRVSKRFWGCSGPQSRPLGRRVRKTRTLQVWFIASEL